MSKRLFVALVLMCGALSSCSNAEENVSSHEKNLLDEINSVNKNMTDSNNDDRLSKDDFIKNKTSQAPSTSVVADEESSKMLFEAGTDVRNEWFFQQLENSGIQKERSQMIELRSEVCSQLTSGETIDSIASDLTLKNYTAHQQGVIIASSMVSQCSDSPVIVDQDMANSVKSSGQK